MKLEVKQLKLFVLVWCNNKRIRDKRIKDKWIKDNEIKINKLENEWKINKL